jgi:Fe2+ transport system protein FeoA
MTTLSEIPPEGSARVVSLGEDMDLAQRLMEMGVLPGTPVRVVRLAPLGDPIDIEIRGYHLSLRRREAAAIAVEPLGSAA